MGKTRKNVKSRKDKTSKTRNLEDLIEEDLDIESEMSSSDSGSDSESESESESEPSMSKELNKMMNETIDDVKDGDLMVPAIGLGLIAIIGFALYKGANIKI